MLIYINKFRGRYNIHQTYSYANIWLNVSILNSELKEKMININIAYRVAWNKSDLSFEPVSSC